MGLFKKLVGDIAKTVGDSLEEVSNEAKKSFQEAREEVRKNIQEAKQNQFNYDDDDDDDDNWDYPLTKLSDDDDDIRIQLGTFKNSVLTIDEGHTTLGEDALEGYNNIRKVVFPSTLREIDGCFFSEHGHEDYLEEVDFSKVHLLKEIPDCLFENCKRLQEINFPEGVEIIGSSVFDSCTNLRKINVPEELYVYYAELLKEVDDTEVRLRKMPADKLNFYGTPVSSLTEVAAEEEIQDTQEETMDIQKESEEIPTIQKSPGNLFSDALEELINSAAASDELTDKMKEIVLRRAVKEGEDPDEVEMVLEARFYEKHN